jgi:hypothetical protein
LSENQELRDKLKQMEKKQDITNAVLANVLSLIQNRFAGKDVNDILRAARKVYFVLLFEFIFQIL